MVLTRVFETNTFKSVRIRLECGVLVLEFQRGVSSHMALARFDGAWEEVEFGYVATLRGKWAEPAEDPVQAEAHGGGGRTTEERGVESGAQDVLSDVAPRPAKTTKFAPKCDSRPGRRRGIDSAVEMGKKLRVIHHL